MTDPVLAERRIAALQKALADPKVRKRRIQNLKKTPANPVVRARISARLIRIDERNTKVLLLRACGESWRKIGEKLHPDFAKDPDSGEKLLRVTFQGEGCCDLRDRARQPKYVQIELGDPDR